MKDQKFVFIGLVIFLLLSVSCTKSPIGSQTDKKQYYEITKVDILKLSEIKSIDIEVMGIKLGDDITKAIDILETPDYDPSSSYEKNYEWSKRFNSQHTVIQIGADDNNKVKWIHIYPGFERYLLGDTKKLLQTDISDERTLHALLGLEDDKEEKNIGDVVSITRYKYFKEGIEVEKLDGKPNGFILVYPVRER